MSRSMDDVPKYTYESQKENTSVITYVYDEKNSMYLVSNFDQTQILAVINPLECNRLVLEKKAKHLKVEDGRVYLEASAEYTLELMRKQPEPKIVPIISADGSYATMFSSSELRRFIESDRVTFTLKQGTPKKMFYGHLDYLFRFKRKTKFDVDSKTSQIKQDIAPYVSRYLELKSAVSDLANTENKIRDAALEIAFLNQNFSEVITFSGEHSKSKIEVNPAGTGRRQLNEDEWDSLSSIFEEMKNMTFDIEVRIDHTDDIEDLIKKNKIEHDLVYFPCKEDAAELLSKLSASSTFSDVKKIRKALNLSAPSIKAL